MAAALFRPSVRSPRTLLALLVALPVTGTSLQAQARGLIEFGWDRPAPADLLAHAKLAQARPFDGVVFRFAGGQQMFLTRPLPDSVLNADLTALRTLVPGNLQQNFVLLQSMPDSGWSWLNPGDWRAAEANLRLFARTAREGNLRGIAFDYEHYGPKLWSSATYLRAGGLTKSQLFSVVRRRGRAFMTALQSEAPGLILFTFFQASFLVPRPSAADSAVTLRRAAEYDLLVPFAEGLVQAAKGTRTILDGNELGYYSRGPADFAETARLSRGPAMRLIRPSARAAYARQVGIAQPVFYDWIMGGFTRRGDTTGTGLDRAARLAWLSRNVADALRHSDGLAWLYSQKINWWSDSTPADAVEAVARGRQLGLGSDSVAVAPEGTSARP